VAATARRTLVAVDDRDDVDAGLPRLARAELDAKVARSALSEARRLKRMTVARVK
jgi:hypothetical protein